MSDTLLRRSVPFPASSTVSGILEAMREILSGEDDVHSVTLEVGLPIRYQVWADGSPLVAGDAAQTVKMEEIVEATPHETIYRVFTLSALRSAHITHIGIGPASRLWSWLGLDEAVHRQLRTYLGAELLPDANIPNEVAIFFVSPFRDGALEDARTAYKVQLEE